MGGSYPWVDPDKADSYKNGNVAHTDMSGLSTDLFTWQIGAFYDIRKNDQVYATVARKSRIGTMRERFMGQRNGVTITPSNSDLKPEIALHYELGYRGKPIDKLKLNTSMFYSDYKDLIVSTKDAGGNSYFTNADKAGIFGIEMAAEYLFNPGLSAGMTYSYMDWDTRGSSADYITFTPKHSGSAYLVFSPVEHVSIIPELYVTDHFYSSSSTGDDVLSPGFATFNLKAIYEPEDNYSFEVGVQNLFDKNYYYTYGYPQAGMTLFAGMTVKY